MLVVIADAPEFGHDADGDIPFALALGRIILSIFDHFINSRVDLDVFPAGSRIDTAHIAVFILAGQFIQLIQAVETFVDCFFGFFPRRPQGHRRIHGDTAPIKRRLRMQSASGAT